MKQLQILPTMVLEEKNAQVVVGSMKKTTASTKKGELNIWKK